MSTLVPAIFFPLSLFLAFRPFILLITWLLAFPLLLWLWRRTGPPRVGLALIIALSITALLSPWLELYPIDRRYKLALGHPLGLDYLGRDLFSRLLAANRTSIFIAACGSLIATLAGMLFGGFMASGPMLMRKGFDTALKAFLSIPILIYYLLGISLLESGPVTLILLIGLTLWPEPARLVQARVVQLRDAPFILGARMRGAGEITIFLREILPNLAPIGRASFLLIMVNAILLESILSYLGLGLEVGTPSLGRLIEEGTRNSEHRLSHLLLSVGLLLAWIWSLRSMSEPGRNALMA